MKTKELIKRLMEADPTGEVEVCVGNVDIHFVELLPAYYDGPLQVLERDETCKYYNIIGGKYKRTGSKVKIHTLSISDAISNRLETKVDYSELDPHRAESTKKAHDDLREWHRKLENQLEWDYFLKWANEEVAKVTADSEDIEGVARDFFDKNVSPEDPYPEGGLKGHSYVSMRQMQWGQKFEVAVEEGFLTIRPKSQLDAPAPVV